MRRLPVIALVAVGAGMAAAPAAAALPAIRGSLPIGYSVIALARDGRSVTAFAGAGGSFRIVPPARRVTLQLLTRGGQYGGPVVVGRRGRNRVIVGIRAGASLGRIRVGGGFGRTRRLLSLARDRGAFAFAKRGRPRGAGRSGRVRLWPSLGAAGAQGSERLRAARRGGDTDLDGVPDAFDVDDDGDLRLDNVDGRVAISAAGEDAQDPYQPSSLLNVGLPETFLAEQLGFASGVAGFALNEHAAPPTSADELRRLRNLALELRGLLVFPLPRGTAELECWALFYCTPFGSGRDITRFQQFPNAFDPDRDGFGTMTDSRPFVPDRDGFGAIEQIDRPVFAFSPGADLRRPGVPGGIGNGDTFLEHFASGRPQPVSLGYVFDSVPAIKSYDAGSGTQEIRYPVPWGGPGAEGNPIRRQAGSPLTLTVWRPQRRAIPGEAGCPVASRECDEAVDVGGLTYIVAGKTNEQQPRRTFHCPATAYSLPPGAEQTASRTPTGVADLERDRATVVSEHTLTFTLDLDQCPFDQGTERGPADRDVYVTAVSRFGDAAEGGGLSFRG
jgi:hypothetical protein